MIQVVIRSQNAQPSLTPNSEILTENRLKYFENDLNTVFQCWSIYSKVLSGLDNYGSLRFIHLKVILPSLWPSTFVTVHLFTNLFVWPSTYLSIHSLILGSICLSIHLIIQQSFHPSLCSSITLSVLPFEYPLFHLFNCPTLHPARHESIGTLYTGYCVQKAKKKV